VAHSPKIRTIDDVVRAVRAAQGAGEAVVMCHGCFDIVHPGHVRHLQHAASRGNRLLVTITGDAMVGKGHGRPLIPQELRAENLAALDCVDWVAVSNEPTAVELLERLRPDVYVKGREYEHNNDPRFLAEREAVERAGGRVFFTSGDVIFSSTALVAALEETASPFHAALRRLLAAHDVRPEIIDRLVHSFQGRRVLVVGEVIRDTYIMCDRPEVAGEAPVMTLRPLERRSYDGGAAVVAMHVAAMGARPTLLTGLPRSPDSEAMRRRLALAGVEVRWIDLDQLIVEKQRFLVGTSKMMKLDCGEPLAVDAAHQSGLIDMACEAGRECDAAIIADYGQGLFSAAMLERLCRRLRPVVPLMAGDVSGRRASLLAMRGVDVLCPSEAELRAAVHDYEDGLSNVAAEVMRRCAAGAAIVTMGADGLTAFEADPDLPRDAQWPGRLKAEHVPAFVSHPVDELGCGDALLAAATLALCAGASLPTAAILGSVGAAAQARRLGNAVVGSADLRRGFRALAEAQLDYRPELSATVAM
jgi:rfaE bifunctional protein kinase chain/domain/rfaE bifunctional protein nucleotidyltransferase chain/domain